MSEEEKMLSGELYNSSDEKLVEKLAKAVLGYLSPKEKRLELEKLGKIEYAV